MPILIAFGNLSMGELRSLDPILIPFYSNAAICLIGLLVCSLNGKGFLPDDYDIAKNGLTMFLVLAAACQGLSNLICWHLKILGY